MILSESTIEVLRNFSSINPSIQFKEGKILKTMSTGKTVIAKAELEDEFKNSFCIFDLSRFLGVVSMFKEPKFEVKENEMKITGDSRSVNYVFASPEVLIIPPANDINAECDNAIKFDLKHSDLKEIIKALGVLSVPDLVIIGDGEKIKLRAADVKNDDSNTYDIEIGETEQKFRAVLKAENLKLLPQDYKVLINPKGIIYFKGKKIEYWVSLEADISKFES